MFFVSLLMMKRVCTALIITLFFILPASGQDKGPEVEWQRVVATEKWKAANDIVAIPSGGFAVAGYTYSEATKSNFWISRLDVTGQIIWEKSLGGTQKDVAKSICITKDGGMVVAGATQSKGAGNKDFWIVKMDHRGNLIWDKTYGDFGEESANSIVETPDGGFVVTGYNKSLGNRNGLVWVLKLDSEGNLEWEKAHGGELGGGIPTDVGNSIVNRPGGGYAIAAHTRSLGAGDEDMYIIVLDALGKLVWEKTLGDTKEEYAYDLFAHDDGTITVAGYTDSKGNGSDDAWLVKLDKSGNVLWDKTYGGRSADQVNCLTIDEKGNYLMAGFTKSKGPEDSGVWILSADKNGKFIWEKTFKGYDGNDNIYGIANTPDGGFAVAGKVRFKEAGKSDVWLTKFTGELNRSIDWYVQEKTKPWMVRGEFEKTEAYQKRISGATMKKVRDKYMAEAINYHGSSSIILDNAMLSRFDADAESFQVIIPKFGKINVAVPLNTAQIFKQNWEYAEFENPSYILLDGKLVLAKVEMTINGTRYEFNYPKGADTNAKLEFKATGTVANEEIPIYRGSGDPLKGLNVARAENLSVGKYYALIIGVDDYKGSWSPLENAVHDARAIEKLLRSKYRFNQIRSLYNEAATRENIINEFLWLVENAKQNDNVFIYYSGHGEFEKKLNKGYWVPVDAQTASISIYISNSDIQTFLGSIASKHTLMVADACFSGDIFRGKTVSVPFDDSDKYFKEVYNLKSVQAISSGGIEPVMDGGRDGHSVFAYYFLKALNENKENYMDGSQLFDKIKVPIVNNSDQSPNFQPVKNTGDEGGQFVFIRR